MLKGPKSYAKEWYLEGDLWELKFVSKIAKDTLALCDPSTKTNYVRLKQSKIEVFQSMLHEFIHSAEDHYKFNLKHDHVYKLEKFFAAFLIENWDSLKKILD